MPKSRGREELSVLVGLEVLLEGVAFDSHDLRKLQYSQTLVTKVLKSLQHSGVLERVNARKYLFTDKFSGLLKEEILRKTPRSGLMQFPAMTVFDMCGIESWTESDVDHFTTRVGEHWSDMTKKERS